jgi:hypothetical protein
MVVHRATSDGEAMTNLHIENTVRDYDDWKANFDKFDRARRDRGVRSYKITRDHEDPRTVMIDLRFDNTTRAEEFREFLRGVMATPQALTELIDHRPLTIHEVMEERTLG